MSTTPKGPELPVAPEAPARAPVLPMYAALVGVGLACGTLIAGAHEATAPVIAQNRAEALERAVFDVLPGVRSSAAFVEAKNGSFVPAESGTAEAKRVHAGYDAQGNLVGVAIEASAMGYQDVVSILYGYDLAQQAVVGMVVLESRETPGLGDRIQSDPAFLENFRHLDVSLDAEGRALRHPIELVKPGEKTEPYQIDTITGATISSSTVGRMVRDSTEHWVPRLFQHRDDFARRGP